MKRLAFSASVKEGRLYISERVTFDKYIASLQDGGYEVSVSKKRKSRSTFQNAYYWGVVVPIVATELNRLGHEVDTDTTHEFLKVRFCYTETVNEETGEVLKVPKSTAQMTTGEFMDYLAAIQRFANEWFGVEIPDPNEQVRIEI